MKINNRVIGIAVSTIVLMLVFMPANVANNDITKPDEDPEVLPIGLVFGFFPKVSEDTITYLSFPSFRWGTILKDEFQGYIGFFIIYGSTGGPD